MVSCNTKLKPNHHLAHQKSLKLRSIIKGIKLKYMSENQKSKKNWAQFTNLTSTLITFLIAPSGFCVLKSERSPMLVGFVFISTPSPFTKHVGNQPTQ